MVSGAAGRRRGRTRARRGPGGLGPPGAGGTRGGTERGLCLQVPELEKATVRIRQPERVRGIIQALRGQGVAKLQVRPRIARALSFPPPPLLVPRPGSSRHLRRGVRLQEKPQRRGSTGLLLPPDGPFGSRF